MSGAIAKKYVNALMSGCNDAELVLLKSWTRVEATILSASFPLFKANSLFQREF